MRVVWPSKGSPLAKVSWLASQVYNLSCFTFPDANIYFSEALNILLEFYKAQDVNSTYPYLSEIVDVGLTSFKQCLFLIKAP